MPWKRRCFSGAGGGFIPGIGAWEWREGKGADRSSALGYISTMNTTFEQMSPAERILYVQDLWDRIAENPDDVPVDDALKTELDWRMVDYRADPSSSIPWETVRERLRARR